MTAVFRRRSGKKARSTITCNQAYLLNTQYLKQMVEVIPAQDEKAKERMRFLARQMADAMAPSTLRRPIPNSSSWPLKPRVRASPMASTT